MDFGLFCRMTEDMRECGVEEIGLFYLGESMMAPDLLVRAIQWCKDIEFGYVFLTSNASLARETLVNDCMAAGLDSLKWSVNAHDAEQFASVMGVKKALFDTALNNIAAAWQVREGGGYSTRLYASSILYDGEQHEKMQTLLETRVTPFVDESYWLPLYSMGAFATQREAELGYRPIAGNQGRIGALREPLPCWSVFSEGHVRSDGGLSACCFDASGEWVMGDLREQSFMDAWNSERFVALREAHLERDVAGTPCESCVAYA